jgi:hypothetical protein
MIYSGRTRIYYYNMFGVQGRPQKGEQKKLKYDLQWQNTYLLLQHIWCSGEATRR